MSTLTESIVAQVDGLETLVLARFLQRIEAYGESGDPDSVEFAQDTFALIRWAIRSVEKDVSSDVVSEIIRRAR